MLRVVMCYGVMLFAILQSGCALSPQQVTIKPDIKVTVTSLGEGRELNVRVEDQRASAIIGTRGGVYSDTSTIEIGNDYKTELAYAMANGFTRWNFKPQVNGSNADATQATLILKTLSYSPDSNPAVGKISITAALSLEIKQGGKSYHGSYSAGGEVGYVTTPSMAKNNEEINKVLNLALQKIFEDQGLINFLQM